MWGMISGILLGTAYLLIGRFLAGIEVDTLGFVLSTLATLFGALLLITSATALVMSL